MHSSFQSTCTQFARVVPAIAALALLASCSLIVDDALNNAPAPPGYGSPAGCGYLCDGVNYARQAYPGGPCECPMVGGGAGVPAGGGIGGFGGTVPVAPCWDSTLLPGSSGSCLCVDGTPGSQTCEFGGVLSACVCPSDSDAGAEVDAGADNDAGSEPL